jgi:hypothetical protein
MKNVKNGFPGNKTAPSSLDFMRFEEGNLKRIELFPNNPLFSSGKRCFSSGKTC